MQQKRQKKNKWTPEYIEYLQYVQRLTDIVSLNTKVYNNENKEECELGDLLVDETTPSPFEMAVQNDRQVKLREYMNKCLSAREEKILRFRYGLDDNTPKTLEEVGKWFGITRERVRQVEHKALRKLRIEFKANNSKMEDW